MHINQMIKYELETVHINIDEMMHGFYKNEFGMYIE